MYESSIEREPAYVFASTYGGELSPSDTETEGGRFWSKDEIRGGIGREVFTPMFEKEIVSLEGVMW